MCTLYRWEILTDVFSYRRFYGCRNMEVISKQDQVTVLKFLTVSVPVIGTALLDETMVAM